MQKPIYELKENPLSRAIYGDETDVDDLAKSLKETGQLTPLLIKPDGTILSGHRRYRAARKAGLITLNVEVRTPRDKTEEELIIISANKQRKKTPEQEIKEVERLRAIYEGEGLQRKSEARKQAWEEYREQKTDDIQSPKVDLLIPNKSTNITETSTPEPEFNIEEIYEGAIERTAEKESQTQHSAIESTPSEGQSTPSEGQSTPSAAQSQPLGRQSTPKPAPINMRKKIAHEMGVSENYVHQLQTIDAAVKAGVPEAKEALDRANKGEITVNRAYEITKKATTPEKPIQIPFSEGAAAIPGTALYEFYKRAKPVGAWVEELKAQLRQNSPDMTLNTAYSLSGFVAVELLRYRELSAEIEDYIARHGGEDIEQDEDEY